MLHRRIAQALERGQAGEPSVEAIAYHYARTDEHARAAHWLERAGDRAAAGFANAAALGNYAAARDRLAARGADADMLSRLDEKQGDLRLRSGEFGPAGEGFARAREGAREPARRAELRRKEGVSWEKRGEYERALATFALAAQEGRSAHDGSALPPETRAALELSRGEVYYAQGEYAAAAAAADRACVLLVAEQPDRATPDRGSSHVRAEMALAQADELRGRVAWSRGDLAWAEQCHRRSLAPRERAGDEAGMATCWHNLGHVAFDRGDLAQAEDCFRRSLTIRDQIGDQEGMAACWNNVGNVAEKRADLGAAEQCYRRGLELHERIGDQEGIALAYHNLGVIAYNRASLTAAEECFRHSLAIAQRIGNQWRLALTWTGLGEVAAARGDLAAADDCHQRSVAIEERLGDQWGLAYSWLNLGAVSLARGDFAGAATRCRAARRLAHRIGTPDAEAHAALRQAQALLRATVTPSPRRLHTVATLLDHGRGLAAAHGLVRPLIEAALVAAELHLRRGARAPAAEEATEALWRAAEGGLYQQEAEARRLLEQCALVTPRERDAL